MVDVVKIIWIIILAGSANIMAALSVKLWPKWNFPMDFRVSWGGVRIFGDHKTWRGLISGVVVAQIIYMIIPQYASGLPWYFGGVLGFGALLGDMIKSFFKRRSGVKPGETWFPWDQIDWVIGVIVVSNGIITIIEAGAMILIGLTAHLLVKLSGYYLKIENKRI